MDSRGRKTVNADNKSWGHDAESIAAEYLIANGYVIRERNWRMGPYEIDIIAEKDNAIVFVEVKARMEGHQDPISAVDRRKRQRTIRVADSYLRAIEKRYEYRFDIITLTGTRESYSMSHYPDAYMPMVNS